MQDTPPPRARRLEARAAPPPASSCARAAVPGGDRGPAGGPRRPCALAAALVLAAAPLAAQEADPALRELLEPPPLPDTVESGEVLEPDIRIIRGEDRTITEYRVNGRLKAVRVEPRFGAPYYLIDQDGDGNLDTRNNTFDPDLMIPMWRVFSW